MTIPERRLFRHSRSSALVWGISAVAGVVAATLIALAFSGRDTDSRPVADAHPTATSSGTVTLAPEQRASVTVARVAQVSVPLRTTVPGRIDFNADHVTPLFAQLSGRVVRLDGEVGAPVRQGQVLGMLDSPDIVAMAAEYQQAAATLRVAQTSLNQATQTRQRAARLAQVEAIPLRDLQGAQAEEARASDELRRAQAAQASARGRLQIAGFTDEDVARLDTDGPPSLTRLVPLVAPVAGTIVERHVGLGQVVQAGGDALFWIADLSTVWVLAEVYEDQLASVRAGAEVSITTPAYPHDTFSARVARIGSTVDKDNRTIAVRCVVPNRDGRLKPGMFATVALQSGVLDHALVVPEAAVLATGDRRALFVETAPGTYQERAISTGPELDGSVVVRTGVHEGERVVVNGTLLLSTQMAQQARSDRDMPEAGAPTGGSAP